MRTISIAILLGLLPVGNYSQNPFSDSSPNSDIISKYGHLTTRQLLDTANYWFTQSADTALICYSLLVNASVKESDVEQQKNIVEAFNNSAILYGQMCDYRTSFEFLIKALFLCEKHHFEMYKSNIYNNIGNIYYGFNKYDMAKPYYMNALELCRDTANTVLILNNLVNIELKNGRMDSVSYYLDKSLQISKEQNNVHNHIMLNNLALFYKEKRLYDSAFYFSRLSLREARENGLIESEAAVLSVLGTLFFDVNEPDSALQYINLSNNIGEENSFWGIVSDNYHVLSQIEESRWQNKAALNHLKQYVSLKDSIFNTDRFGEISQLQRLYEVSKMNQLIENMTVEQQIKERTIRYRTIIMFIAVAILVLVSCILLYVFSRERKLKEAYKTLVEKNMEIVQLQENDPEQRPEKYRKSALPNNKQEVLLNKILQFMEDTPAICDPKFSIDKLAEAIQSNRTYVSQVINDALGKNFRSFLNTYRIREAQRLFSDIEAGKYTIESIALRTGFKSQSAFYSAFKEITGVNPLFYLKSMKV